MVQRNVIFALTAFSLGFMTFGIYESIKHETLMPLWVLAPLIWIWIRFWRNHISQRR